MSVRPGPLPVGVKIVSAILLAIPVLALLIVPIYARTTPRLWGFPFFYWYQLAWVPITSLLIWLVYRRRTPDEAE